MALRAASDCMAEDALGDMGGKAVTFGPSTAHVASADIGIVEWRGVREVVVDPALVEDVSFALKDSGLVLALTLLGASCQAHPEGIIATFPFDVYESVKPQFDRVCREKETTYLMNTQIARARTPGVFSVTPGTVDGIALLIVTKS